MIKRWLHWDNIGLFLLISYCIWGAVSLRWITEFVEENHPLTWAIGVILLLYGFLLGLEPLLFRQEHWRIHLYLAGQTLLIFLASLLYFELDFFAMLYVPLCGQAIFALPRQEGSAWLGILLGFTAVGQIIQFGLSEALSFILLYSAALIFVAAFGRMVCQANEARQRSEQLLAQLQEAHQQLQRYANQAEELAVANERTRLARELHDSVAQTLYGLTLQAEAAKRKLTADQTEAVQTYLQEIKEDAQQTLQETRLLIFELRPQILAERGLTAALQARLDAVEARSGLTMHLELEEVQGLSDRVEMGLYRVAQEALNNVARHAQASELHVRLAQTAAAVLLRVADNGRGFESEQTGNGHLGLQGMAERVEQMNGRLTIDSAPDQGVSIEVEVPL